MIKPTKPVKSRILSIVLFLALSCPAVFSRDGGSPVGTWELAIARAKGSAKETGTVFITFNEDNTLTAYGLTSGSFSVFTWSGTWQLDAKGNLTGGYTNVLFENSFEATFAGKVTPGKTLAMTSTGLLGKFKSNGVPMKSLPDISGSWKATVLRMSAVTRTFETYQFTNSTQFPGVVEITGSGASGNSPFTVSGLAIVTAKGKVTAFKINDFGAGQETDDVFVGKFQEKKQTIGLLGNNSAGLDVITERVHLARP